MILVGSAFEFEIRPLAYEFLHPTGFGEDSEWLKVYVRVGGWSCVDPCLRIGEAYELADWLAGHALRIAASSEIGFLEPNLSMNVNQTAFDAIQLRIHLAAECRPPAPIPSTFDLEVFPAELHRAADELRNELRSLRR